ncbi:MAG TPA: cation diffusion facilitator family transporter [Oscillospiraceae bacterium]|nr:cation diffusion facilitator family transporter [Oscillospiraceae bacterium]
MTKNFSKVKQVLWAILFANLAVAVMKIAVGTIIRSTSMTADGFHSFTDGTSNIVGLIGVHFASQPEDQDHPYGHSKFEMFAGLFIAGMLFLIGGKIIIAAIGRFFHPVLPEITSASLLVLLLTLGINIFVSIFEYRKGKALNSQILISDSLHTRSDIYVSAGVLITLIGIKLGLPPLIDSLTSLVVAGFIIYAAFEILCDNGGILLDKAAVDAEKVQNIVLSFDEVKDTHNIRSRGSMNDMHIDLHIMTEPDLSVEAGHDLIHSIEAKIRTEINQNIQVSVHLEPYKEDAQETKGVYC